MQAGAVFDPTDAKGKAALTNHLVNGSKPEGYDQLLQDVKDLKAAHADIQRAIAAINSKLDKKADKTTGGP